MPQKGEHRDYTQDQGFGTGLGWDPEQEDVWTEEPGARRHPGDH